MDTLGNDISKSILLLSAISSCLIAIGRIPISNGRDPNSRKRLSVIFNNEYLPSSDFRDHIDIVLKNGIIELHIYSDDEKERHVIFGFTSLPQFLLRYIEDQYGFITQPSKRKALRTFLLSPELKAISRKLQIGDSLEAPIETGQLRTFPILRD
jgi:hypothetical protein